MTAPGGAPGWNPYGPDESGHPADPRFDPAYPPEPQSGTNTMAIASLATSIVGVTPYFGGILSIVGIVLGTVALNQIKQTPQDGYGLAVAGIVVGVATLIIGLIWTIYAMR